jgi:hypothetical protein
MKPRRKSRCGTLKTVKADFTRAVRAAVRLAQLGRPYAASEQLKRAHSEMYWCARREGYADVTDWQKSRRRPRRRP